MRRMYGNFADGEYLFALRLANKLADLRAANANPCDIRRCVRFLVRVNHRQKKKKAGLWVVLSHGAYRQRRYIGRRGDGTCN